MVLLLLAVIWATVLIPPMVRARAENRPAGSIVDFNRRLGVLARTTPLGASDRPHTATGRPYRPAAAPAAARPLYAVPVATPGRSVEAARRRRSIKRRRDVLVGLLVTMAGSLVLGFLPPLRVLWIVHLVVDVLFVAYVAALIYLRNLAAEREMKVRFLPPPRPAADPVLLLRRSAN